MENRYKHVEEHLFLAAICSKCTQVFYVYNRSYSFWSGCIELHASFKNRILIYVLTMIYDLWYEASD